MSDPLRTSSRAELKTHARLEPISGVSRISGVCDICEDEFLVLSCLGLEVPEECKAVLHEATLTNVAAALWLTSPTTVTLSQLPTGDAAD